MSTYCVHMLICLHNVFNCCISAFRDETCDCFLSERYTAILSPVNVIRVLNEWLSTRIFSYAVDFVCVFVAVKWNAVYIIVMWYIWLYMCLLCTTDSAFVHTCSEVVHCKLYYMWKNWLYVSKKDRYTKWAVDVYFSHNQQIHKMSCWCLFLSQSHIILQIQCHIIAVCCAAFQNT